MLVFYENLKKKVKRSSKKIKREFKKIKKNIIRQQKKFIRSLNKNKRKILKGINNLKKKYRKQKRLIIRFYKKQKKSVIASIKKIQRQSKRKVSSVNKLRQKKLTATRRSVKQIKHKLAFFQGLKKGTKRFFSKAFSLKKGVNRFFSKAFSPQLRRLYASLLAAGLILGSSWWVYQNIFKDLPDPRDLTDIKPAMTTRILDRNGRLLYRLYQDENRTPVSLADISQHMINATVAIEDQEFYSHYGFSIRGIFRALFHNIKQERVQGGSTITQQLVKNRLLGAERTLNRKIRELILAILVEGTYTKPEILQMYLNEVAYGGSTYGIEEASWRFFNKPAKDLTLGESALLAGLPAAPSIYSPFGPNPELSFRRQEEVLRRMVEDEYISLEEAYRAKQEKLALQPDVIDIQAPHFVMHVKRLLADKFGEQMVNQGGLEVRTSLDLSLQQQAQEIVTRQVALVERLNINNGAALVINPQTGEILAMVGSKNYFDFEHDGQVNVTLRPRQPGSAIKPLTYALAFETGRNPWDVIDDSPITYQIPGSRPYSPRNYDGRFRGRVSLRHALAGSLNIPAVKLLAGLGVENLVEFGRDLGISTWADSSRFGLSLTLGAGEVLMTDLATAFGTFANNGYTVSPDPFLEIRDHQGKLLYRNQCFDDPDLCKQFQTVSAETAYLMNDILSDGSARSITFGLYSLLHIPNQQVAVKTGTTNDRRDNWTVGYTADRLVGTWVGNNDNSSMSYVASGMTGASPIWNEIMRLVLDENNPHVFSLPEELIRVRICVPTRTLPCPECPLIAEEVFVRGEEPTYACDWRYFVREEEES